MSQDGGLPHPPVKGPVHPFAAPLRLLHVSGARTDSTRSPDETQ
jgi:hypothetical protein